MSENYYSELAKLDVSKYVEKKGKFSYLSWAYAVDQLKKRHPDATWEIKRFPANDHGTVTLPYLKTEFGTFVEAAVTVNGITHSQIHPVLDNNNRPIEKPNAFQINTSIQRALVKAIALHGLGLYIYAGEDLPEVDGEPDTAETPTPPNAREVARERARQAAAKKAAENANDNLPFDAPQPEQATVATTNTVAEPINEGQLKAITQMLKMVSNKKKDFNQEEFLKGVLAKFGASELNGLTFEQGKELLTEINAEMRKK
jgi:hypothetical protein